MNILQSLFGEAVRPKLPLHVGEVMLLWTYYTGVTESRAICQMMTNHTKDKDLRELIEHFIADLETPMIEKMADFLLNEGIPLPATTGDRPHTDEGAIPPGAKMTDSEVAQLLVVKLNGMLTVCHQGLLQSVRSDISRTFYAFQSHLLAQGFSLKNLMLERGWLKQPPIYRPEGVPRELASPST